MAKRGELLSVDLQYLGALATAPARFLFYSVAISGKSGRTTGLKIATAGTVVLNTQPRVLNLRYPTTIAQAVGDFVQTAAASIPQTREIPITCYIDWSETTALLSAIDAMAEFQPLPSNQERRRNTAFATVGGFTIVRQDVGKDVFGAIDC